MLNFFSQNLGTILISLALAAGVALILRKLLRDRRAGKSACSCSCSGACQGCTACRKE